MEPVAIAKQLLISALPILVAITFHEASHGFVAYRLGDSTAKMLGRLTLNPIAHIDLFGTIILPILLFAMTDGRFVFGYAKPVPINPMNFKNPRRDMALSAAAGPVTNILLAGISALLLHLFLTPLTGIIPEALTEKVLMPMILIFTYSALINIILAAFNMLPVPPLDGGRVLTGLLPYKHAISFSKIEPFGFIIVLVLIYTNIAHYIIMPIIAVFVSLFQVTGYLRLLQMF